MNFTFKKLETNTTDLVEKLGSLRIEVFREYPYLYDGDLSYEKDYISRYLKADNSFCLGAFMNDQLVGATTGIPLSQEIDELKKALGTFDSHRVFYFGESIIKKEFRGQGVGHRFFEEREKFAKSVVPNLEYTCFCAVDRGEDHPLKPKDYRGLDNFWKRMGYQKHEDLVVRFPWKDIDKEKEDEKPLIFWMKKWN